MKRYILIFAFISMQPNITLPNEMWERFKTNIKSNFQSKMSSMFGYFKHNSEKSMEPSLSAVKNCDIIEPIRNTLKPKQENYDELVSLLRKRPLKKGETVYYNGEGYTVYDRSLPSYWSASHSHYALVRSVKFLDRFYLATDVIDITQNLGNYKNDIFYGGYIDIQHTRTYNIGKNGYKVFLGSTSERMY